MSRDKTYIKGLGSNHVPHKMEVNFNVLGSCMKNRIGGEVCGSNVVTPKNWRSGFGETKFKK